MSIENISEKNKGFKAAAPLIVGYIPLAITFGMIAGNSGFSLIEVLLMSTLIYSGAGQFMILSLLSANAGTMEIVLTATLLNSRMFLMATSFVNKISDSLGNWKLFTALTLTDETFSVIMFRNSASNKEFIISLNTFAIISWIFGTTIGFYFGNILPEILKESLSLTLYAMFTSMLMPQLKKSLKLTAIVLLSGFINTIITYTKVLPNGWGVILGIVIASAFATFFLTNRGEENE